VIQIAISDFIPGKKVSRKPEGRVRPPGRPAHAPTFTQEHGPQPGQVTIGRPDDTPGERAVPEPTRTRGEANAKSWPRRRPWTPIRRDRPAQDGPAPGLRGRRKKSAQHPKSGLDPYPFPMGSRLPLIACYSPTASYNATLRPSR
jgi:hypothetical protein